MGSTCSVPAQQVNAAQIWVNNFYKTFDTFDLDLWFRNFFQDDTVVSICNNPPLKGFNEIREHFEQQHSLLTSMKHKIIDIDILPDRIYVENEVAFIVNDDPKQKELKMKVFFLIWKKINEDKTTFINIYFD